MTDAYGAVISGLTDVGQAFVAHHAAKEAWHRQKTMMKNAVRWRMQDMERAGINPILAGAGSPTAFSAAQMQTSGIGEGTRRAGQIMAGAETRRQAMALQEEQKNLASSQGVKNLADANSAQSLADLNNARREGELPAIISKLGADAGLSSAHAQKIGQDIAIDSLGRYQDALAQDRFLRANPDAWGILHGPSVEGHALGAGGRWPYYGSPFTPENPPTSGGHSAQKPSSAWPTWPSSGAGSFGMP